MKETAARRLYIAAQFDRINETSRGLSEKRIVALVNCSHDIDNSDDREVLQSGPHLPTFRL